MLIIIVSLVTKVFIVSQVGRMQARAVARRGHKPVSWIGIGFRSGLGLKSGPSKGRAKGRGRGSDRVQIRVRIKVRAGDPVKVRVNKSVRIV